MGAVGTADRWFALVVRTQRETLCARWLAQHRIGHRLRTKTIHRKTLRGFVEVKVPAMPGYLPFIVPAGANLWGLVELARVYSPIRGVVGLSDGTPLQLDGLWEERLRGIDQPAVPIRKIDIDYAAGDQVKLTELAGALEGLMGPCVRVSDKQAIVLLKWFNGEREFPIPPEAAKRAA